ncbi:type IV pilus modification protein PilV [Vitreoscilla massiliensis]|uniref:Type IV pilus modification protein PilV n=1 Tax=Vitreoscilla massiliensis TaxID=1689272 RepID=A0ABY4E4R1_9NEIS|nr:type IV pilus modification protein PilV [Vitreoscilla massiliensis]UOO88422.1 type IV pilus modification protein PilV [Vitreoscilla massiliensis]
MKQRYVIKTEQKGSTLLEVLVSVFVLGFGLLALVSMQVKTVMTAREAENQTIVAQATDTLLEGMMMNPNLTLSTLSSGDEMMTRSFESYTNSYSVIKAAGASCNQDQSMISGNVTNISTGIDKDTIAAAQLCTFVKRISQIPNAAIVDWKMCKETSADSAKVPQLNTAGTAIECGGSGENTVIKVMWTQEVEDIEKYQNSGLKLKDNAVLYGYQATLGQ